jgi:hypothetical protein
MPTRTIAYLMVSTDKQADRGDRVDLVRVGVDAAETLRRDVALLLVGPPAPHEVLGEEAEVDWVERRNHSGAEVGAKTAKTSKRSMPAAPALDTQIHMEYRADRETLLASSRASGILPATFRITVLRSEAPPGSLPSGKPIWGFSTGIRGQHQRGVHMAVYITLLKYTEHTNHDKADFSDRRSPR